MQVPPASTLSHRSVELCQLFKSRQPCTNSASLPARCVAASIAAWLRHEQYVFCLRCCFLGCDLVAGALVVGHVFPCATNKLCSRGCRFLCSAFRPNGSDVDVGSLTEKWIQRSCGETSEPLVDAESEDPGQTQPMCRGETSLEKEKSDGH